MTRADIKAIKEMAQGAGVYCEVEHVANLVNDDIPALADELLAAWDKLATARAALEYYARRSGVATRALDDLDAGEVKSG